ncbi:MAG: FAD-dependent oxidoreductase [Planctomycetes bacterium]|nr:FAD-dependent oxidoreductase [Planctomycetota bacterium]
MTKRVLVLGGGITGLTAALRAAESGLEVELFEATRRTGGMGGSMNERGFVLDHGIHGLYSARKETQPLVREMVERFGSDFLTIQKKTSIHFRGRYLKYPMGMKELFRALPLLTSARCVLDFVRTRVRGRLKDIGVAESFEHWVSDRFGHSLYEIYFGPYVEKVWGLPGTRMSSAWLARRISQISIATVVRRALKAIFTRRPPDEMHSLQPQTFLYPRLGSGQFVDRVRDGAVAAGAVLHEGWRVRGLRHDGARWSVELDTPEGPQTKTADAIVNSLPLPVLISLLGETVPPAVREAASGLRFRAMTIVNLFLERERIYGDQWVYYSSPDLPFNRINEFTNLAPGYSPPGRTALNCEITCFTGDATWTSSDEALAERCIASLERLRLIRREEVSGHSVARLPNAYPIFDVGCETRLDTVLRYLRQQPELHTAGRQGRFEYINMDECIWHATEAIAAIRSRASRVDEGARA